MEDEECLPEESDLNVYLQNLGFGDVEVTKKIVQNSGNLRLDVCDTKDKRPQVELIDEDVIDQIRIIVSTQLLFEEDFLFIENLLSHFEVVKSGILKCMFKNLLGVAVILIGVCFYWVIGYYALILVSTFYAYNAAHYLKRRYYYRIRLKKLSSVIQGNYFLLKKTIKFIEESNLIESKFNRFENSTEFLEGFDCYKKFKGDFLLSVNKIIHVFIKSTQKLINKVPLHDYIENPEYYLCNNFKKNDDFVNLSRLFEIYLLLQSEFLKRLILSLIPNLQSSCDDNFSKINEILGETCLSLLKIKKTYNKKFQFLFFHGIHSSKTPVEFKLPKKYGLSDIPYMKEFYLNIHEVSKICQNLLLKCRIFEENIKSEKMLVCSGMEDELTEMLRNINFCQKILSENLILLKKSKVTDKCDTVVLEKREVDQINEELNKVEVGYTNLDPKVEDEIFEMCLASEKAEKNFSDKDDWELNDWSEKKFKKECSKNLMKELKLRLAEKAQDWKKREKELLKRKGLNDASEDYLECKSKNTDDENEDDLNLVNNEHKPFETKEFDNFRSDLKKSESPKSEKGKFDSKNVTFKSQKDLWIPNNNCISGNCEVSRSAGEDEIKTFEEENANSEYSQSHIGAFKANFFNDLNKARQKIFKSSFSAEEELFCDSNESNTS